LLIIFYLKGFDEPAPIYRVEQRHRTRIISNAYVLLSDLRGFTRLIETEPVIVVEGVLNTLDTLISGIRREFGGVIRRSERDSNIGLHRGRIVSGSPASREWRIDLVTRLQGRLS